MQHGNDKLSPSQQSTGAPVTQVSIAKQQSEEANAQAQLPNVPDSESNSQVEARGGAPVGTGTPPKGDPKAGAGDPAKGQSAGVPISTPGGVKK